VAKVHGMEHPWVAALRPGRGRGRVAMLQVLAASTSNSRSSVSVTHVAH
jgi:hypothetical protein